MDMVDTVDGIEIRFSHHRLDTLVCDSIPLQIPTNTGVPYGVKVVRTDFVHPQ